MVKETVEMLAPSKGGIYVDGTIGAGGHARAVLENLGGEGTLIGIDRDGDALKLAAALLKPWHGNCRLVRGNFSEIRSLVNNLGFSKVNGILFDLGISSMQIDQAERGFSFKRNGSLDMRMDCTQKRKAADIIEELGEKELAQLIVEYGEEPSGRRIARAILLERARKDPWTTQRLARIIESAIGRRRGRIHPATRTFQALRIAVNDEIGELGKALEAGIALLAPGGRLVVIAYHSLEDRQAKFIFKKHIGCWVSKPEGGKQWEGAEPIVKPVIKKPLRPSRAEILANPRARSAKMRCIERVG